jgi:hypothetical protein
MKSIVKMILTKMELPAIILGFLFFEVRINLICAFFSRLPFDISNAATTNKNIDQIPNSVLGKTLASIKKFKKPNRVLENLWRIDSTIDKVM